MYKYVGGGATLVSDDYIAQSGETLYPDFPPPSGAVPSYDAALTAEHAAAEVTEQQGQAQSALDKSDVTYLRAQEAGLAWPTEWVSYRAALRAVAKDGGDLPAMPTTYPDGTATVSG